MMRVTGMLLSAGVIVGFFTTAVSPAAAQPAPATTKTDCGMNCHTCANFSWEGRDYSSTGPYNMDCTLNMYPGGCATCTLSVNGAVTSADEIAGVVKSVTAAELRTVVAAYGDRLLLNVEGHSVVVQGTPCAPNYLAVVINLSPAKTRTLQQLGVQLLQPAMIPSHGARTVAASTP